MLSNVHRPWRNQGKISSDVCLFDEMYLQKCEEYFFCDLVDRNNEGELYKRLVCFIIVGLKKFIPYVIKSSPETKINAQWLKEELIDYLWVLSKSGFNVRTYSLWQPSIECVKFQKPVKTL